MGTRTLTLGDLGYTGATNANYITNNNQLTNGAGYTTNTGDITGVTAGTGLDGGGTSGAVTLSIESDLRGDVFFIGRDTNDYIAVQTDKHQFFLNGTEYMRIDSNGVYLYDGSLREDYDALSGTSPNVSVNNGGAFSLSMSGNTTFTFSGAVSGMSNGFILQLTGNGSTVTWPSSVKWAGGAAPDAPASGETDVLVFHTRDGGSNWYGVLASDAAA